MSALWNQKITTEIPKSQQSLITDDGDKLVAYHKWVYVKSEREGKVKTTMSCAQKAVQFKEFFQELLNEMETYPAHIFRASWQQRQMALCISTLEPGEAMMLLDFSEYYACRYHNEVQSAFFDHNQVTILPVMVYYRGEGTGKLIKHSMICISNDPKHNSDVVKVCEDAVVSNLKDQGITFKTYHQFTDGSAAQFKGRKAFADITL